MTDLNRVTFGGRVTKDSTVEKAKNGLSFMRVNLAMNRSFKKKDSNEYVDKATFIELVFYGTYAESMAKYFFKGNYITGEGYLDMDSWTDENGKKQTRLKVVPVPGSINPWIVRKNKSENASEECNMNTETDIYIPESEIGSDADWPPENDPGAIGVENGIY